MKRYILLIGLLCVLFLAGCSPSTALNCPDGYFVDSWSVDENQNYKVTCNSLNSSINVSQLNITIPAEVDTLQSVSDRGAITSNNLTANYFIGNGSLLTGIVSGGVSHWDKTNNVLSPTVTTDNIELTSEITNDIINGDFASGDTGWSLSGAFVENGYLIWADDDGNEEGDAYSSDIILDELYEYSVDYDITINVPYDTQLELVFNTQWLEIPDGSTTGRFTGTLTGFHKATSTTGFFFYVEDYTEGANIYKFTNFEAKKVDNEGVKFSNFIGTDYGNGYISSPKLFLNVDDLIYTGLYSNDIDPAKPNQDIGSSWLSKWGKIRSTAIETGTIYRGGGNSDSWIYMQPTRTTFRVENQNIFNIYDDKFSVNDNYKATFGNSQDGSIWFDGLNMNYDLITPNTALHYFEGNISVENLIDRSIYWNKSDGSALESTQDTNEINNNDKNLNTYERMEYKVVDHDRPVVVLTCDTLNDIDFCYNVTTYPYTKTEYGRIISASIGKHEQALREIADGIDLIETTKGVLVDTDIISAETIYTESKMPTPSYDYASVYLNTDISKKDTHYATVNVGDQERLDMEERIVHLEGAMQQIITESCQKDQKYSWCNK